ncbi:protocadherin beta-2 [Brachionus plicatilis]|uniref:Protocadherin beta-2 n=1 Tax=Brachionus plicatilis TaxID=10195 RepID=A0A3M7T941_BRAPC|nr:protocadherin beta-2 [Brachionus plicatilis]
MSLIFCYIVLVYFMSFTHQTAQTPHILFKKLSPVQVYENLEIGHQIIDLKEKVIDLNEISYENAQIVFEFLEEQKFATNILNLVSLKEFFILDEYSGIIRTSKSIDLEHFCNYNLCQNKNINNEIYLNKTLQEGCHLNFKIRASKQYDNRAKLIYQISFDLIIHDINEFHPIFSQKSPLTFSVNEEFSPIELLIGSVPNDKDCMDKSQIYYHIKILEVNQTKFQAKTTIENSNFGFQVVTRQDLLFLYSNKPLDREVYQSVTLDLIAFDRVDINEANTAYLKIIINIIDINDNSPVFKIPVYSLEFDEGLPSGTELIRVEATDLDQGQNGLVSFEFASLSDQINKNFLLNRTTGLLYLKNKLTSDIKNWTLQIKASDHGSNKKSNFCLVHIQVKDVNNHKPEMGVNFFVIPGLIEPKFETIHNFDKNTIRKEDVVFLPKSLEANTTIGILSVYDPDSGPNGQIEGCEIFSKLQEKIPIFLQNFNEIDRQSESYSSNGDIDEAIKMLVDAELDSYYKASNEQKYLIRTKFNFDKFKIFNIELRTSDSGLLDRQTGSKSFKMIILNANILNNQFLDEDDVDENFSYDQEELIDYDEEMSMFSRLGLKVNLNENNLFPISLAKLTSANFGLNMPLKYDLYLPTNFNSKQNYFKKSTIFQCSLSLFKYLSIDQNGIIRLNRSLDREICQIFKFYIKGESVNDKRISSIITFKINVIDLNDNPPRFEKKHFKFEFIRSLNKTFNIPIRDSDLKSSYIFRIESLDHSEKISDFIKLQPDENFKSINLLINEKINFGKKNKYLFNLIVIEASNLDTGMVNSDIALIEIDVLNEEELRPAVKKLSIMGDLADKDYSSIKMLNDTVFFVYTNYENLINKLRIKDSSTSETYLSLLKIDVQEKSTQNYRKEQKVNFSIQSLKFYDSVANFKNKTDSSFGSKMDTTELFLLTEPDGILNVNLDSFKKLNSKLTRPFICFIEIKIHNKTNMLFTNFTIILSINRKAKAKMEIVELENYLKQLYLVEQEDENLSNRIDKEFFKKKFKTINCDKNTLKSDLKRKQSQTCLSKKLYRIIGNRK